MKTHLTVLDVHSVTQHDRTSIDVLVTLKDRGTATLHMDMVGLERLVAEIAGFVLGGQHKIDSAGDVTFTPTRQRH